MSNNNTSGKDDSHNMTLFGYLHNHPYVATIVIILLVIVIAIIITSFLVFGNVSVKLGAFEINKSENKTDTVYSKESDKDSPNTLPVKYEHVKNHQPVNNSGISSKTNNGTQQIIYGNDGVIGDYNNVTINGKQQLHLDSIMGEAIIKRIKSYNLMPNNCIEVASTVDDHETYILAKEIWEFLRKRKYNVDNIILEIKTYPPAENISIYRGDGDSCLTVFVGHIVPPQ